MFMLPEIKPSEVLIYLRKSRTDDPALTVSEVVAKHEQMLDDFCMDKWNELVPEQNRFREIVSGETIDARPEVQKVLHLIEQPRFRAVLVVEPQRLSRGDLEDIGRLIKFFRFTGTLIITLQGTFDMSEERYRDYLSRELMRGNDYLEYSKRIMRNGVRASMEAGYYIGSEPPYGYKKTRIKIGKKSAPTLEIDEDEAPAIQLIFRMYAEGFGAEKIRQALVLSGYRPKKADYWSDNIIFRILDNPHYIGKIRFNYRNQTQVIQDGEVKKTRKSNKTPTVVDGIHPAIIDMDLWQKVREQRSSRHVPATHSTKVLSYPLAGLVYCECGSIMIQASKTQGRKRRIYCKHQAECGNVSAILDDVIDAVSNALISNLPDISVEVGKNDILPIQSVDSLQGRLAALEKKKDALWEQLAEGMPHDTFDRLMPSVTADIEAIKEMIETAKNEELARKNAKSLQFSVMDAVKCIKDPEIPAGEKNKLLKDCIKKITYHRRKGENFRLDIELKF